MDRLLHCTVLSEHDIGCKVALGCHWRFSLAFGLWGVFHGVSLHSRMHYDLHARQLFHHRLHLGGLMYV